ncbi:MAG TPA: rhodanese-like domain-containing protein [Anaeromyxobacter sp.]
MKAILSALLLAASACAAVPAAKTAPQVSPAASSTPEAVIVDGKEAHRLVASGVKVVDVRTPEEFADGHVPGALNIPYDEVGARLKEIGPPSTPVLVYCYSGGRAATAAKTLQEKGYQRIYNMEEYDRWVESEPAAAKR